MNGREDRKGGTDGKKEKNGRGKKRKKEQMNERKGRQERRKEWKEERNGGVKVKKDPGAQTTCPGCRRGYRLGIDVVDPPPPPEGRRRSGAPPPANDNGNNNNNNNGGAVGGGGGGGAGVPSKTTLNVNSDKEMPTEVQLCRRGKPLRVQPGFDQQTPQRRRMTNWQFCE
uniref:Uncharacterized protein n=1 Tax=Globodera rostochiensis TaxID=31243 RepID=A0A914IAT5_GLORO